MSLGARRQHMHGGMLAKLYSSQTRARSVNTQVALATTKKNQLSVSYYYSKMSQFVDDLAAFGALLRDAELVAYLLSGMDEAYNPVFTSIVACVDPITPSELYSQLLRFEQHKSLQSSLMQGGISSAMTAFRGVATLLVVGDLVLPLVPWAVVVAATNVVASPINRIAATTVHLPLGLSVKFALRLVIPPKPVGIAMMMIPLSLALQASQPQVPLRTCGALIHGQQTILLTILTS
jgi:hypothetical protein